VRDHIAAEGRDQGGDVLGEDAVPIGNHPEDALLRRPTAFVDPRKEQDGVGDVLRRGQAKMGAGKPRRPGGERRAAVVEGVIQVEEYGVDAAQHPCTPR
jgi:hypothetical protein